MKVIDKFALIMVILLILSLVPNPLFYFLRSELTPEQVGQYNTLTYIMSLGNALCRSLVCIGAGIWLFILARQDNGTPWIWLLFGLTFGLMAVVLFFLIKVYKVVSPASLLEKAVPKPNPNQ